MSGGSHCTSLGVCLIVLAAFFLCGCSDGASPPTRAEIAADLEAGRIEEAVDGLALLVRENPGDLDLQLEYGRALVAVGSLSRAVFPLSRAMEKADHTVKAGLDLTRVQLQMQDGADALRTVDRVLALDPGNPTALTLRVEALLQEKKEEEALTQIEEAREASPEDVDLVLLRFRALLSLERIDEAAAALDELRELTSDAELGNPAVALHFCVGSAVFAKERGEAEKAEATFEECLASNPDAARNPLLVQEAARFFDERGEVDRATGIWQQAFDLEPADLRARVSLAYRLRALNRKAEAEALVREATEQQPRAWLALVDFHVEDEDFEKAAAAMQAAIESHPEPADHWFFSLADYQIFAGDLSAADATCERIDAPVYRLYVEGRLLYARGRHDEAYEVLVRAVRLWPDNGAYRYFAGLAADRAGRYDDALDQFKEAARLDPPPLEATLAFAELMAARNQESAAIQALNRLAKAHPGRSQPLIALANVQARAAGGDQGEGALRALARMSGQERLAVAELVRLAGRVHGPERAITAADNSNLNLRDPANFVVLSTLARILAANGRSSQALERTAAAVAAHPDSAVSMALHAEVLAGTNEIEKALEITARARAASPDAFDVRLSSARVARAAGRTADARRWALAALEVSPLDKQALLELASLEAEDGATGEALHRLSRALDAFPHDGALARGYTEILFESGAASARQLRDASLRAVLFGGDQASHLLRGRVLLATGDPEAAVAPIERAKSQPGPDGARATYYLGIAELERGNRQDAARHLREAIELGGFSELEAARERLRSLDAQPS